MPIDCAICFVNSDADDGVYYAGQMLSGRVALTLTEPYNVRGKHPGYKKKS